MFLDLFVGKSALMEHNHDDAIAAMVQFQKTCASMSSHI